MEDTFANRLKEILTIRDMKQVELCEKTKLSSGLINKYLKGKAFARQDKLSILAEALDTNEVWLMGYDVPINRDFGRIKTKTIYIRDMKTNKPIDSIPLALEDNDDENNYFAIKAIDQSMSPLLDIGDVAIIHRENNFTNKGTYLMRIKKSSSIIGKIVETIDGIDIYVMSTNRPIYEKLQKSDIEILGKVVRAENQSAFK